MTDAIEAVAVALLRGAILRVMPAPDEAWGVIDTRHALVALLGDLTSDGWVRGTGPDSPAKRFSREDAETCARRLTGSSACGTVYEAVEMPPATRATVGHFAVAGEEPGSRFACVDWTSGPGEVVVPEQHVPRANAWGFLDDDYEDDWSAFGAALAFVRLVGARAAFDAVAASESEAA